MARDREGMKGDTDQKTRTSRRGGPRVVHPSSAHSRPEATRNGTREAAETCPPGSAEISGGARRAASVMFADLRGFTRLSAMLEPEAVVVLLNDFLSAMSDVAVGQRATIDKIVGDAVIFLYGVPSPRRDDPMRAVRAALEMQRAFLGLRNRWIRNRRPEAGVLGLGIGIATGDVVVANVAPVAWQGYTVFGETMSRAAALSDAAQHSDVLIDQMTYDRVAAHLDADVVIASVELDAKGIDSVPVYRCQLRRSGLRVVARRAVASELFR